jgi:hypothetical protein
MGESAGGVRVTTAEGVKEEIAELTAASPGDDQSRRAEVEALKLRIAELFLECESNPYVGELMGRGLHPELADCRRVRFDIEPHKGKPRFRLIYRNQPTDAHPPSAGGSQSARERAFARTARPNNGDGPPLDAITT